MNADELIADLPGEALVRQGLADFKSGKCTVAACLIGIARGRLMRAGLLTGAEIPVCAEPERQLYQLLREASGDAYSRYNSLLREFVSFEHALDRRLSKTIMSR